MSTLVIVYYADGKIEYLRTNNIIRMQVSNPNKYSNYPTLFHHAIYMSDGNKISLYSDCKYSLKDILADRCIYELWESRLTISHAYIPRPTIEPDIGSNRI